MILKPTSIVWDARGETEGLEERSPSSFRSTGTVARHRRMKFVDIPGAESGCPLPKLATVEPKMVHPFSPQNDQIGFMEGVL